MSMTSENTVPEGYMRDAQGRLVPLQLVKPIDQERDRLVIELVGIIKALNGEMVRIKEKMFGDVFAFLDLSAEQYGVKRGGKKGNVTLFSFDGRFKLQLQKSEAIAFDERLQAAKELIDACAADWSEGSRAEVKVIIQEAFRTDKEGNLSVGRILGLRRWEITDARWQAAMKAIGESTQTVGSKQYIRVYERVGDTDRYEAISLDMAAV